LERADRELGNDKSHQLTNHLRSQADQVIRSKNVLMGRDLLDQIHTVFFQLTMIYQCMGLIRDCSNNFGRFHWKDSSRARQLVNQGMAIIGNNPTVEQLQPIAAQLVGLMPDNEAGNKGGFLH
jgi:molecular chaperone DnaK